MIILSLMNVVVKILETLANRERKSKTLELFFFFPSYFMSFSVVCFCVCFLFPKIIKKKMRMRMRMCFFVYGMCCNTRTFKDQLSNNIYERCLGLFYLQKRKVVA